MTVTVTLTLEEFDKVRAILNNTPAVPEPQSEVTLEQLTTKAKSLMDTVGIAPIKEVIAGFGVKSLPELDKKDYPEMMKKLEGLA